MLSKKMQDLMNAQIQSEFYSAQLYLSMSAYSEAENYKGFAHWLKLQYKEETSHGMKFLGYILERGGEVDLRAIEAPPAKFGSMLKLFEEVLAHEQKVTALINKLMDLAIAESDHATISFLKWFVDEQVEEEANVDAVIQDLKRIGGAPQGLFILDRELAGRTGEEEEEDADAT